MKVISPSDCWPFVLFTHETPTLGRHGASDRVQLKSIKQLEHKDSQLQGCSSSHALWGARPLRGRCRRRCSVLRRRSSDCDATVKQLAVHWQSCPWCWNHPDGSSLRALPEHHNCAPTQRHTWHIHKDLFLNWGGVNRCCRLSRN